MEYNIFLDNSRTSSDMFYKFNNPVYRNCITIKNYKDFVEYIETNFQKDGSYPGFISFDFHLSDVTLSITEDKTIFYNEDCYQETGYECALWVINFCKSHNLPIPKYFIHDDNSYGKRKISKIFSNIVSNVEQPKIVQDPFTEKKEFPKEEKIKFPKDTKKVLKVNKKFSFEKLFDIVKDTLTDSPKSRKELVSILINKLPNDIPEKQKFSKINNLLYLYKVKSDIKSMGKAVWCLPENQKVK